MSEDRQKSALTFCMAQTIHGRSAGAGIALIVRYRVGMSNGERADCIGTHGPAEPGKGEVVTWVEPAG